MSNYQLPYLFNLIKNEGAIRSGNELGVKNFRLSTFVNWLSSLCCNIP